ncbi:MAG: DUF4405 domain-containing protein [Oligoflexia bacterium]|nr:DUF4405 domain-containing protein [Oligoflexia bacterium]
MKQKIILRITIDLIMIIFLLIAMLCKVTGNFAHALIGFILLLLFIAHHYINICSYKSIFQQINFNKLLNLTLLIVVITLLITSILMAEMIFDSLSVVTVSMMGSGRVGVMAAIRKIHVLTANWAFLLISIHLGRHLNYSHKFIKQFFSRIICMKYPLIALFTGYGIYSFFTMEMYYKLILYYSYDYFDSSTSNLILFFQYLSIMMAGMLVTHFLSKYIERIKKINQKS